MSASHGTEKSRHRTIITQWHLKCTENGKFFLQETSLSMETRRENVAIGNGFSSASERRIGLWNCDLSNIKQPTLTLFKIYNLEGNVTCVHLLHVISRELMWDQCDVAHLVVSKIVQPCGPFFGQNRCREGREKSNYTLISDLPTYIETFWMFDVHESLLSSCLSITSYSAERGVVTTAALQPNERTYLRTLPEPLWYF